MSTVFRWDIQQNTAEWLAVRMAIPTASEMGKIISPTGKKSTQSVAYRRKLLWEYVTGLPMQEQEDAYQSPWMEHGHEYEETTVKTFEFATGLKCERCGFISNWDGLIGASPDRVVMLAGKPVGCAEFKSPAPHTQLGYLLDKNSLSDQYYPQLQAQLFISELDEQFMCSDHHRVKAEPVSLKIGRDDKYIQAMAGYLREFVDTMLEERLRLKSEFGLEPPAAAKANDGLDALGVTMEDVEAIINANNR